jgi:hypothetical protein
MKNKNSPQRHGGPADSRGGDFGTHGIFLAETFTESNGTPRTTMGVHAGREGKTDQAGRKDTEYATNGCIRTTEDAMDTIETTAKSDPLDTITVVNNKPPVPPGGGGITPFFAGKGSFFSQDSQASRSAGGYVDENGTHWSIQKADAR